VAAGSVRPSPYRWEQFFATDLDKAGLNRLNNDLWSAGCARWPQPRVRRKKPRLTGTSPCSDGGLSVEPGGFTPPTFSKGFIPLRQAERLGFAILRSPARSGLDRQNFNDCSGCRVVVVSGHGGRRLRPESEAKPRREQGKRGRSEASPPSSGELPTHARTDLTCVSPSSYATH
jgi:hypothetical protein